MSVLKPFLLTILAGTCTVAVATSPPKAYFWSVPEDGNPITGHPTLRYAVEVPVGIWNWPTSCPGPCVTSEPAGTWSTPLQDASRVKCRIDQLISSGHITADDVCLILRNFGIANIYKDANVGLIRDAGPGPTSLFVQPDEVDVDTGGDPGPDWPTGGPPFLGTKEDWWAAQRQPWMVHSRNVVQGWMNEFLASYALSQGGPAPTRFHFDSEEFMTGDLTQYVFLLERMALDEQGAPCSINANARRWNCEPVPGHFDPVSGAPQTMADLWDKARTTWTGTSQIFPWNQPVPPVVHTVPNGQNGEDYWGFSVVPTSGSINQRNRDIFLWYYDVTQRALDGAMKQVAYDPIKTRFPNAKVSDYETTFLLPGTIETGWNQYAELSCNGTLLPASTPTRSVPRGVRDTIDHGQRLNDYTGGN